MQKTKRLVILIEPELMQKAKALAEKNMQSLSELIRESLKIFLFTQKVSQRSKKLKRLGRYNLSLKGLETIEKFNRLLNQKYF